MFGHPPWIVYEGWRWSTIKSNGGDEHDNDGDERRDGDRCIYLFGAENRTRAHTHSHTREHTDTDMYIRADMHPSTSYIQSQVNNVCTATESPDTTDTLALSMQNSNAEQLLLPAKYARICAQNYILNIKTTLFRLSTDENAV